MRVGVGFNLFNKLQSYKIENERFFLQDHNHHVFSKFDIHNQLVCIKSDLRPILFLMIIPNNHLVALIGIDKDYHICFVHHLHDGHLVLKVLDFLLKTFVARIILEDFEAT